MVRLEIAEVESERKLETEEQETDLEEEDQEEKRAGAGSFLDGQILLNQDMHRQIQHSLTIGVKVNLTYCMSRK